MTNSGMPEDIVEVLVKETGGRFIHLIRAQKCAIWGGRTYM